ncbi:MAG: hypothetical protein WBA07_05465 [Rivularia sp. (in: cyanobacteria)]
MGASRSLDITSEQDTRTTNMLAVSERLARTTNLLPSRIKVVEYYCFYFYA